MARAVAVGERVRVSLSCRICRKVDGNHSSVPRHRPIYLLPDTGNKQLLISEQYLEFWPWRVAVLSRCARQLLGARPTHSVS